MQGSDVRWILWITREAVKSKGSYQPNLVALIYPSGSTGVVWQNSSPMKMRKPVIWMSETKDTNKIHALAITWISLPVRYVPCLHRIALNCFYIHQNLDLQREKRISCIVQNRAKRQNTASCTVRNRASGNIWAREPSLRSSAACQHRALLTKEIRPKHHIAQTSPLHCTNTTITGFVVKLVSGAARLVANLEHLYRGSV